MVVGQWLGSAGPWLDTHDNITLHSHITISSLDTLSSTHTKCTVDWTSAMENSLGPPSHQDRITPTKRFFFSSNRIAVIMSWACSRYVLWHSTDQLQAVGTLIWMVWVWDLFQSGITGRVSEEVLEWNCQSIFVLRPELTFICFEKFHNLCCWSI